MRGRAGTVRLEELNAAHAEADELEGAMHAVMMNQGHELDDAGEGHERPHDATDVCASLAPGSEPAGRGF